MTNPSPYIPSDTLHADSAIAGPLLSRLPLLFALVLSIFSTPIFWLWVTLFFAFTALNAVVLLVLLIGTFKFWMKPKNRNGQIVTLAIGYASTFLLLLLPWFQMLTMSELPGYRFAARLVERGMEFVGGFF